MTYAEHMDHDGDCDCDHCLAEYERRGLEKRVKELGRINTKLLVEGRKMADDLETKDSIIDKLEKQNGAHVKDLIDIRPHPTVKNQFEVWFKGVQLPGILDVEINGDLIDHPRAVTVTFHGRYLTFMGDGAGIFHDI